MNKITFYAAILASIGVALGAFGAHALKETLLEHGTTDTWKTAVFYHLLHAVAAWSLFLASPTTQRRLATAATAWLIGIILFSGSLYFLALGGPRWLGPVTPLGGLAFLGGWLLAARAAWSTPAIPTDD